MIVYINDQEYSFDYSLKIIEACKAVGIFIPTMCYDKSLNNHGKCRLCIVEVDDRLLLACENDIHDKMRIYTKTDRVLKAQKATLLLILKEHNVSCLTCQKSNNCLLQDTVFKYDIKTSDDILDSCSHNSEVVPFMGRLLYDRSKCISCGRCIKNVCNLDLPNPDVFMQNGVQMPGMYDVNTIIDLCPTGALMENNHDRG